MPFDWESLTEYLTNISSNECIILGKFKYGKSCHIVGSEKDQNPKNNQFNRSTKNFEWNDNYQLCYFDFDGFQNQDITPTNFIEIISEIIPEFQYTKKIIKYSSSANIYNANNELVNNSNSFHIYFLVNCPEMIEEVFSRNESILSKKLWLNDYGYIKNTNPSDPRKHTVRQLVRCIYDNCVFSPERIIFEGKPQFGQGLYSKNGGAEFVQGTKGFLDLSKIKKLTKKEEETYRKKVQNAKEKNEYSKEMIESKKLFSEYISTKIKSGAFDKKTEYQGLSESEIIKREFRRNQEGVLLPDHCIKLESGEEIKVLDILENPNKYNRQKCYEPAEPDYNGGASNIGIIYSEQDQPIIYSHAHGGINYKLKRDEESNELNLYDIENWLDTFFIYAVGKNANIYHIRGNKITEYNQQSFNLKYSRYGIRNEWLNHHNRKDIDRTDFTPGKPILYSDNGELVLNDYVPYILKSGLDIPSASEYKKSAEPFLDHIKELIHNSDESDILIDWFSYLVQFSGERPMWSPLIISEVRGTGKDMMTDILTDMFGDSLVKRSSLENLISNNSWDDALVKSKLVVCSECGSNTQKYTISDALKDKITAVNGSANPKFKELFFGKLYCGLIFYSNYKNPFYLEQGDRRFFVTRCEWTQEETDKRKQNGYFHKLSKFYEGKKNLLGLYVSAY